jgi:hypothetical protein
MTSGAAGADGYIQLTKCSTEASIPIWQVRSGTSLVAPLPVLHPDVICKEEKRPMRLGPMTQVSFMRPSRPVTLKGLSLASWSAGQGAGICAVVSADRLQMPRFSKHTVSYACGLISRY